MSAAAGVARTRESEAAGPQRVHGPAPARERGAPELLAGLHDPEAVASLQRLVGNEAVATMFGSMDRPPPAGPPPDAPPRGDGVPPSPAAAARVLAPTSGTLMPPAGGGDSSVDVGGEPRRDVAVTTRDLAVAPGTLMPPGGGADGGGGASGPGGGAGGARGAGGETPAGGLPGGAGGPAPGPGGAGGGPIHAREPGGDGKGGARHAAASEVGAGAGPGESDGASGSIDYELAEHQRWAQAGATVGAAESPERAAFLADMAGRGLITGLGEGFSGALKMGIGIQLAEHMVPIPGVGLVIGGYMALQGIVDNWDQTAANISSIGQGADFYEQAANTLAGIASIIDLIVNILNVIGGIAGAISVAMWIITAVTVGLASPLATTISLITGAVLMAAGILNGILQASIQPVIAMFRALHAFKSQGDPRSVMAQGQKVQGATGIMGGQLGGMAGMAVMMAAQEQGHTEGPVDPAAPHGPGGEPPSIEFEPPAGAGSGEPPAGGGATGGGEPPAGGGSAGGGPERPGSSVPNDLFGDGEFVFAEPYEGNAPVEPPVDVPLDPARMEAMSDMAESGDERGFHTDEALYEGHNKAKADLTAEGKLDPSIEPRVQHDRIRAEMVKQGTLPADYEGPIHHHEFPMKDFPGKATDPGNLYATRTNSPGHQQMHRAFGARNPGHSYRQMQPGYNQPGMRSFFDFANTAPQQPPLAGSPAPPHTAPPPGSASPQAPPTVEGPGPAGPTRGADRSRNWPYVPVPSYPYPDGGDDGERGGRRAVTIDAATGAGAELVNPHYSNPPGTPQQIAAIRSQIAALQRERDQTRQARATADRHTLQAKQLQVGATEAGQKAQQASGKASEIQQTATEREGVNQQAQGQQGEAQGAVAGYHERAAGLAVLITPLNAFRNFLGIAQLVPGPIGAKFHEMNGEAGKFQRSLAQVGVQMAQTAAQGPGALAGWQAEQQTLVGARAQALGAQQTFEGQTRQANQIAEKAAAAAAQRTQAAGRAQNHEAETGRQIDKREDRAAALATELATWAGEHKQARIRAIEETKARYEQKGYRVTVAGA